MLAGKADFCIMRPPAVYGPGDRATLPIFRQIKKGLLFVPAADARFSLLYVDDLAEIVARLLEAPRWDGAVMEPDDDSGGYGWADVARIASAHLDRRVRTVPVPWLALRLSSSWVSPPPRAHDDGGPACPDSDTHSRARSIPRATW